MSRELERLAIAAAARHGARHVTKPRDNRSGPYGTPRVGSFSTAIIRSRDTVRPSHCHQKHQNQPPTLRKEPRL